VYAGVQPSVQDEEAAATAEFVGLHGYHGHGQLLVEDVEPGQDVVLGELGVGEIVDLLLPAFLQEVQALGLGLGGSYAGGVIINSGHDASMTKESEIHLYAACGADGTDSSRVAAI
jgi:hypothetical protein